VQADDCAVDDFGEHESLAAVSVCVRAADTGQDEIAALDELADIDVSLGEASASHHLNRRRPAPAARDHAVLTPQATPVELGREQPRYLVPASAGHGRVGPPPLSASRYPSDLRIARRGRSVNHSPAEPP
jgi:hypothetical protein